MKRTARPSPLQRALRLLAPCALALLLAGPLAAQAAAPGTPADSARLRASQSRSKGADSAPVTIVELSDFQCPFCREFAQTTLAQLDSAYVRTGQVRLVFFNLPLPSHPAAWPAAEAALCAGAQDRFWPMHDRLFDRQAEWSTAPRPAERFQTYAAELGLDATAFAACLRDDLMAPVLSADLMQAARSGATATPVFILNGEKVLSGAQPFEEFQAAIEELLGREQGAGDGEG